MPIPSVVRNGYPTRVGSRGEFAAVCAALLALAFAGPAGAQLPTVKVPVQLPKVELPLQDGAVGDAVAGEVVEDTLNEPLPAPVEDVVNDSPVAPLREEVRRVVSDTTGGGGGGSGSGSGGSGSSTSGTTGTGTGSSGQDGTAGATPGGGSGGGDGSRRGNTRRRTSGGGNAQRAARNRAGTSPIGRGTPGRGGGDRRADRSGSGSSGSTGRNGDDGGNPLTTTVEKLVQVVPRIIWLALGVLLLAAIGLGGRTFVERRRARALEV